MTHTATREQHEKEKKALMKVAEDLHGELQAALTFSAAGEGESGRLRSDIASLQSQLASRDAAAEADATTQAAEQKELRAELLGRSQELAERTADLAAANAAANEARAEGQQQAKRFEAEFESQLARAKEEVRAAVQREAAGAVEAAQRAAEETAKLYAKESKLRRELHNRVMELQGNIRVICRVRPIQPHEIAQGGQGANVVSFPDKDLVRLMHGGIKQEFEFEHVFQPDSTQQEIFQQTCPLVISVLDGYNVCIFAYGQTGSGKTFTMDGPADNPGVNQRALMELFRLRDERASTMSYAYHISMLEVYNETVVDLLDESCGLTEEEGGAKRAGLDVRMGKAGVYVAGLVEVEVMSMDDVNELLQLGVSNRSVGAHNINEHSSRSHLVFSVRVEGQNLATGSTTSATLHLIDLAGSERLSKTEATGQRLKEAQNINRSLSALGDVIHSLGGKSKHVPYRNSKLTFLLQNSLSGNSKVQMIVNSSPVLSCMGESVCSLNFATRCRSVALGQATANSGGGGGGGGGGGRGRGPARPIGGSHAAASPGRALLSSNRDFK
jgi:kinesin family protein C2/C3